MIDPVNTPSVALNTPAKPSATDTTGGFDAALKAAQKAAERDNAHQSEMAAIKDKGFSDWVRDTQIEKLKEELRKKVMEAMGLDEEQLSRMSTAVQQVLEQKIQEEVERQLAEITAKQQGGKGESVVANAAKPVGTNDPQGNKCPVIPGLAWPGGASLF